MPAASAFSETEETAHIFVGNCRGNVSNSFPASPLSLWRADPETVTAKQLLAPFCSAQAGQRLKLIRTSRLGQAAIRARIGCAVSFILCETHSSFDTIRGALGK